MAAPAPATPSPPPASDDAGPLSHPFRIGSVVAPNRVVLAPMAGVTSSAYRTHYRRHGAGLVVTEMVSAYGLTYRNRRTEEYLAFRPEERPIAVQLFGDEPEVLREAAELVLARDEPPDILDLNLGCPVRKVLKTGAGCALAGEPERAAACVAALVGVAGPRGVPVTAKIRSGPVPGEITAVELAQRLEEAGASALALHPRAASQMYRGRADHDVTGAVVAAVDIPVIASGDVTAVAAAHAIVEATGAAAVMVARGGQGNPWLVEGLVAGTEVERPPLAGVVDDLLALLHLAEEDLGADRANRWIRKHLSWYLRPSGVPPARIDELRRLGEPGELRRRLRALAEESDER